LIKEQSLSFCDS